MKSKKSILVLILSILLITKNVDAASSYSMTLNTTNTEVEKNSVVDIYITINNINEIPDGINACMFNLEYDNTKIEIQKNNGESLIGQNGWKIEEEQNIVMDGSAPITNKADIGKIRAKILDNSTITIKNIECSDGNEDLYANNNSLSFTIKKTQPQNSNGSSNGNSDNEYNSSGTVESEKLGIKELSIAFLLIAILSFVITKIILKKDLFKKI